jgi:hypothetical protein
MRMFPLLGVPMGGRDTLPPTVVITSNAVEPVSAAFTATLTFSEAVVGFVVGDITAVNCALSDFATADNITFTATCTPDWAGDVSLSVAAGVCTDAAGNENAASNTLALEMAYFVDPFDSVLAGWSGAGSVSAGVLTITPTTEEKLLNGSMETGDPPTSWDSVSNATLDSVAEERTGGAGAACLSVARAGVSASPYARQDVVTTPGQWYGFSSWQRNVDASSGVSGRIFDGSLLVAPAYRSATTWAKTLATYRAVGASSRVQLIATSNTVGQSGLFDDCSLWSITGLFHGRLHSVPHGVYTATVTRTALTQAGLWVNGNHPSAPTIYRHIYDGGDGKMYIDNVNGATRTPVGNYAFVYSENNPIIATVHEDLTLDLTVGVTELVTGVPAMGNEGNYWGLFSTYIGNFFGGASVDSSAPL